MSARLLARTTVLPGGNSASVLLVPRSAGGAKIRSALQLEAPRGLLVLNGGTEELPPEIAERLRSLLQDGLARVALHHRLTVLTGATDAGVFRLFGEGLGRDRPGKVPCIGVAPAALVAWAETDAADGESGRVPLEQHHTHFVLVEGGSWGNETEVMLSLVEALSADAPSLAVLANGGSISKREVLGHVRAGRELVVLSGSGRLADEITDVVAGRVAAGDPELAEIAAGHVTLFDSRAPASALAELVGEKLGSGRPPSMLRRIALFSALPGLRWKPQSEQPFVSEWVLARCPDLRPEIDLLEHELVPRFRHLDRESLRTQNSFRLGQLSLIVGGAAAAALGAVQAALGGGVVGIAVAEALLAGVLAGATVYIRGRNAQREYFTSRLRAERLRAEYFLVLAHAGDYADVDDGRRLELLHDRIRAIEEQGENP